ncbi:MAG: tRNA (adenosine(37)-N6)-dimethylallyltransferase MiaA [Lachnospiraceae bacterium]|jgi:tRNA dimethylallyltransferase|nr:tRNA (adenosine(37)-N6)-dimethylallyltransferase MiaA [Lachnospiraceae bacterium]
MKETSNKPPLLIIAGPTAIGKSSLAVTLAKQIGGEVVSADSMQVYRGMNIGSAKITTEEMRGIPHHGIDILDPWEEFHVVKFQQMAKQAITEIHERGRIPILTGGTGFYIQAILYDIDFTQMEQDNEYRLQLEQTAQQKGASYLHEQLQKVDPKSAQTIHPHNSKRIIRALEFHKLSGCPISEHNNSQHEKEPAYQTSFFVLTDDRAKIYERINKRVEDMIAAGLVAEVQELQNKGCHDKMTSMQGLGYREILAYLNKKCTLDQAIDDIKKNTRHFAKRQLTWFRRERETIWLDRQEYGDEKALVCAILQKSCAVRPGNTTPKT